MKPLWSCVMSRAVRLLNCSLLSVTIF
uniref:Uncharacterized protein n=1 Tax=Arundo donax TaxID=35708 RepID=A0A0A9A8D5_ARUDO